MTPDTITVTGADGTVIGATTSGHGEDVVLLVHGTCGSRRDWDLVAPLLVEHGLRVVAMDRRGRGLSGHGEGEHSIEVEAGDVAAVAAALDGRVHVAAHSFGAICAVVVAARSERIRSLVLYEPPAAPEHVDRAAASTVADLVAAGELSAAARTFLDEVAAIPREEVAVLESIPPIWEALCDGARTAPREADAVLQWVPPADAVSVPALLLMGELTTSPLFLEGAERVASLLPALTRSVLPGQRHLATGFAPADVARAIASFTLGHTGDR